MKLSLITIALALLVAAPATQSHAAAADSALSGIAPARGPESAEVARPGSHRMGGGAALGIGLASTFGPAALSLIVNPPGNQDTFAWEASLASAAAIGLMAGPAVGLASGGRGDLARRGLIVRGCGEALTALGLWAVVMAMSNDGATPLTVPLVVLGAIGGTVSVVSVVHDLAITPSAVNAGRHAVRIGLDQRGRMAATVRF